MIRVARHNLSGNEIGLCFLGVIYNMRRWYRIERGVKTLATCIAMLASLRLDPTVTPQVQYALLHPAKPTRPFSSLMLPHESFFQVNRQTIKGRAVFAWYMTCCSAFGGTAAAGNDIGLNPAWPASPRPAAAGVKNYKKSIMLAQSAGFDGYALDEGASGARLSNNEKANISAIFEAARQLQTDFRIYFVFDQSRHHNLDYQYLISTYRDHPNYFRHNGAPVASAYAADQVLGSVALSSIWWSNRVLAPVARADEIFWVPVSASADRDHCQPPTTTWEALGGGYVRGASAWQIVSAPMGAGLACQERYAQSVRAAGVVWVGTYAWHYWMGSLTTLPGLARPARNLYSEHGGGMGLARSWASIIDRQSPVWVTMLTANDYQESYGETVDDYALYREKPGNGTARFTPLGWYKSQAGMAELNRYYAQWYKSGVRPTIVRDALFYAYLTMPQSYRVPAINRFHAKVDDGNGRGGRHMVVSAVDVGYVVPGETLDNHGATIVEQLDGAPYGKGTYLIDTDRNIPLSVFTTRYAASKPVVEMNGEPVDGLYVTAAISGRDASLSVTSDGVAYDSALVDGFITRLPAILKPGIHQIRVAPFRVGTPVFKLTRGSSADLTLKGEVIAASGPVYAYFPTTGFAHN